MNPVAAALVGLLAAPTSAAAAPLAPDTTSGGVLDVFEVTTSNGVTLAQWQLSLPGAGWAGIPNPFITLIQIGWFAWRVMAGAAIWCIHQASDLTWLQLLRGPLTAAVTPVVEVLHQLHLPQLVATWGVAMGAFWFARGRAGAALTEWVLVAVMAALALGLLSSPVTSLSNPDGAVVKARDLGAAISTEIGQPGVNNSQRLADILVGQPAQLLNFGQLVPPACQDPYAATLKAGPHQDDAAIRNTVKRCDPRFDTPDIPQVLGTSLLLSPTLWTVSGFSATMALLVVTVGLVLVWLSIQLVWDAIKGIAPGPGRGALIKTLTQVVTGLVIMVILQIVLAVTTQGAAELFTSSSQPGATLGVYQTYLLVDALVVILSVISVVKVIGGFRRARKNAQKLHDALSPKPTTMPKPLLARALGSPLGGLAGSVMASAAGNRIGNHRELSASASGGATGRRTPPGAPTEGSPPSRVATMGHLAWTGTKFAAAATVGLPVSAPKWVAAGKTAVNASRSALADRLTSAKAAAGRKADAMVEYGQEWTSNTAAAAKWTAKASGVPKLAAVLAPARGPGPGSPGQGASPVTPTNPPLTTPVAPSTSAPKSSPPSRRSGAGSPRRAPARGPVGSAVISAKEPKVTHPAPPATPAADAAARLATRLKQPSTPPPAGGEP